MDLPQKKASLQMQNYRKSTKSDRPVTYCTPADPFKET